MKEYSNDEITIYWDPKKCIHSRECVKCLPGVFDPHKTPWINLEGASSEEIMKAIDKCPSGALSYKVKDQALMKTEEEPAAQIRAMKNGPLLVKGPCLLIDEDGTELTKGGPFALCRCDRSKNKPYCDGSHKEADPN
jgi:uncharacterized Fe-S cluster protein YjdI